MTDALNANLNTPRAFAAMHRLADRSLRGDDGAAGGLAHALGALGVPDSQWRPLATRGHSGIEDLPAVPDAVQRLLDRRHVLRQAKDWAGADAVRHDVEALGYVLEDRGGQTQVRHRPG